MSSEDTLPGVPADAAGDAKDVSKTLTEFQAKVYVDAHVDAKPKNNGMELNNACAHSNGTEIDPIASEESNVPAPLAKQMSIEPTGHVGLDSGNSVTFSNPKEKSDSFVVQMLDSENTPPLPRHSCQRRLSKWPTLMSMFSRDSSMSLQESSLTLQESWRTRSATTRLKSKKNYISYHNITYTVPQGLFFQDRPPKLILNNIRLVSN